MPPAGFARRTSLENGCLEHQRGVIRRYPAGHQRRFEFRRQFDARVPWGHERSFYLLTSTNLAAPLANWSCVLTNQFDANGNSRLTNAINPNLRQSFYLLQAP